jgi:cell division protein FtsB
MRDPRSTPANRAANLTGRAAILAVVVCMLAISLAYPLREYLSQRGEIAEYESKVAEQRDRVEALQKARERWEDPAYVEAQARERLHYVMPGETAYVVLEADEAPETDGVIEPDRTEVASEPWFTDLWRTVEAAGAADRK